MRMLQVSDDVVEAITLLEADERDWGAPEGWRHDNGCISPVLDWVKHEGCIGMEISTTAGDVIGNRYVVHNATPYRYVSLMRHESFTDLVSNALCHLRVLDEKSG